MLELHERLRKAESSLAIQPVHAAWMTSSSRLESPLGLSNSVAVVEDVKLPIMSLLCA